MRAATKSAFDKTSDADLMEYLGLCARIRPSLDVELAFRVAKASVRYYRGGEDDEVLKATR